MIEYFTPNSTVTLVEAYLYGAGVVFMACLYSLTDHPYVFAVLYTGMKMRIACCSVLYRKVKERKSSAEEADRVSQFTIRWKKNYTSGRASAVCDHCDVSHRR